MRTMKSKRGDTMAFITLDDRTGRIEASLFGELFEQLRGQIESDQVIIVEGEVSSDDFSGGLRLRGKDVTPMVTARVRYGQAVELALDAGQINGRLVESLRDSLTPYRDNTGLPVRLQYRHPDAVAWLELAEEWKVAPSDDLLLALRDVQGQVGVQLRYR
jgi:DNA polymerase-3 subunit alpha